jgi:hypothetical protein
MALIDLDKRPASRPRGRRALLVRLLLVLAAVVAVGLVPVLLRVVRTPASTPAEHCVAGGPAPTRSAGSRVVEVDARTGKVVPRGGCAPTHRGVTRD